MIFVSYDPESNGENHTADDLGNNYFTIKTFFLQRGTHKKCKVEQTEQEFGKSCAAIHVAQSIQQTGLVLVTLVCSG